jgi:hypothetical protein
VPQRGFRGTASDPRSRPTHIGSGSTTWVSARWLAYEYRAGRVGHIHIARRRRFTHAQDDAFIRKYTVEPVASVQVSRLEQTRDRVASRLRTL